MYAKVSVKGDDQTPLYKYLTESAKDAVEYGLIDEVIEGRNTKVG